MKSKIFDSIKNKFCDSRNSITETKNAVHNRNHSLLKTKIIFASLSLLLSILLWAFVAWDGNSDIVRSITVPIQYSNTSRGYSAFENTKNVTIRLSGRFNTLSHIEQGDISAKVNLDGLQPGKFNLPIDIETPSLVKVRSWQPTTANVEIYRYIERTIPITLKLSDNGKNNLSILSADISPAIATVSGPEDEVMTVQGLTAVLPSGKVKNGTEMSASLRTTGTQRTDSRITISPRSVNITPYVGLGNAGTNVPVKAVITGHPQNGLEVDYVKITPDHVFVKTKNSASAKMKTLLLPPVDITGLDQNLHLLVPLQSANTNDNIEITGPEKARIDIILKKKVAVKTYSNVQIMLEGNGKGQEWKISPQSVTLTIEGNQSAVDTLKSISAPCELYVDVSNIVSNQLMLPVLVKNLRKDLQIVQIEPEQVVVTAIK
jgi:YbbR domain-containing protein